jgi:hypothetical protein
VIADVRREGPTPAGGAYSVASFFDSDGNPVEQDVAVQVRIREYDAADRMLAETIGTTEPAS